MASSAGVIAALKARALWAALFLILTIMPLTGCWEQGGADEDALDSARQAYTIGHFSEAERIFEKYLEDNPDGNDRWEVWNRLLDISRDILGDYEKSVTLLDSMYLEFGDDPERAWDLLTDLGDLHESVHNWSAAAEVWKRILNLGFLTPKQRGKISIRLARVLRTQKDFIQADQVLATCVENAQDNDIKSWCLYEAAQNVEFQIRKAQAQTIESQESKVDVKDLQNTLGLILERIRSLDNIDQERFALATFMLADLAESQGKNKEARELFASIADTYPNPMVIKARLKNLGK